MTTRIAIVGIGGQGRECLDIAEAMITRGADLTVVGFFDDNPSEVNLRRVAARGYDVLGGFDALLDGRDFSVCLGIGDGAARSRLGALLLARGHSSPVLVHPDSTIGSQVELSEGVVICAGARLTTNITLGRHVLVNQNATIGHDCRLDDYVTISPLAAVSGGCTVGAEAMVGAGAVVLQGLSVGERSVVGASACVVRDVPPGVTVKGVPAQ